MARKAEPQRRIDRPTPYTGGGLIVGTASTPAPPAIPTALLPPDTPVIGDMFVPNSAVTPTATVNLTWDMPQAALEPVEYAIQWALDSGFTNPTTIRTGSARTNAAISGLPTGTAFWVRV